MSMVTSCPACTTTFRITPEQLKQREGKVRCGKCRAVFDAFKSLATLRDDPSLPDAGSSPTASAEPAPIEAAREPGPPASAVGVQASLDIGEAAAVAAGVGTDAPVAGGARRGRAVWLAAAVLLGLLLGLQVLYLVRDQVAGAWPASRPLLEHLCKPIGCTVSFPRRTENLAIESSDLQADPQRPGVVVLSASLRNRGSSLVAHPSLELTLTNAQDQAVARRVIPPADYLPDPGAAARGMAGMAEVNVRIALDTGDLKPAGYRLFLFYP